jgi:hypothetical protein
VTDDESRRRCEVRAMKHFGRISQRWVKRQVRLEKLSTSWREKSCDSPEIEPYVKLRMSGSPYPPVFIVPAKGEVPGNLPGRRWIIHDGNHRVRAAECTGDEFIDAFIPMKGR